MQRFFLTLLVMALVGLGLGLYLGWVQFPQETINTPFESLDQRYKDDYVVMVAAGFRFDNDLTSALERLRVMNVENIPASVQDVTERYITTSRDINDIRHLVALSEGLGRLTPIMEPYRDLSLTGGA
jgi:hypothetical protein